ncbi:MAG: PASTA domain-containing protein [Clostridia bacterium]|nr:PASTA domain-containing protein [Clostridia bacterium]
MTPSLNSIKKRILPLVIIVIVCMAALVLRLVYWQIIRGEEMSQRARAQQTGSNIITASRGDIYDRNGKVLAQSTSVDTLICNPNDIKKNNNVEYIVKTLSPILDMDENKLRKLVTQNSNYQVIKKRISNEESKQIKLLMDYEQNPQTSSLLNGLYFEADSKRFYPYAIAPHILGFTGYDNNGLQGIELTFDSELSGKSGSIDSKRTAGGTTVEKDQEEYLLAATKGADVVLTIDETIQHFLEKHLEEAIKEYSLKEGAAGIVMNPKTGEILAMSTKPDFDANNPYNVDAFSEYIMQFETPSSEDEEEEETEDKKLYNLQNKMWRNKAISDSYEPGSTFKIITAAAALEENVVNNESSFYCPGFRVVADRHISCANKNGHGAQNFEQAVQNSCNPAFMDLGIKLGSDKFMEYFTAFGLTEKTDVELVGESSSIYYKKGMSEVDLATSSFGQGIQVTPIQLITAISAVINGGERMKPQIVKEIRNSNGIVKSYEPQIVNRVISKQTSDTMRTILEKVVSSPNATGKNAYVKGCRIGGKTGTSEKAPRGSDKRIASFVGFAPANDPEIICLVMLDEPQTNNKYGGTIAAPLVGELIEDILNYLGVEKQYSADEEPIALDTVPNLIGTHRNDIGDVFKQNSLDYVIKGKGETVIEQIPPEGTVMREGSLVILYTEEHEEEFVTVPDFTNISVNEAKASLKSLHLNFEVAGAGHSEIYSAYGVKQSVEPGERVPIGTVIGVEFRQTAQD